MDHEELVKLLVAIMKTSREGTPADSFSIQGIFMQVERQFIEVKQRQVVLELPESFINHRVEVIVDRG